MKKMISILLTLAMILALGSMTVFADPVSVTVSGNLVMNATGATGTLTGTGTTIVLNANFTVIDPDQWAIFGGTATINGDAGTITTGKINYNGYDTLFATITTSTTTYYLTSTDLGPTVAGICPVTGTFFVANPVIPTVTDISLDLPIDTYGGHPDGSVYMDLNATITSTGYSGPLFWSVWVNDKVNPQASVSITQTGMLTINDIGSGFTVIANTLDPTLKSQNFPFNQAFLDGFDFSDGTEVTADADVSYMVVIPSSVDFGTIFKNTGVKTKPFPVSVEGALVESDSTITVSKTTTTVMKMYAGSKELPFTLSQDSFVFTTADLADGAHTIPGVVGCDTANLTAAGSYLGYMTFEVDYRAAK